MNKCNQKYLNIYILIKCPILSDKIKIKQDKINYLKTIVELN